MTRQAELLAEMIQNVVAELMQRECKPEERDMLLGIACVESDLHHRKQIGGGSARGLWQMELATAQDIFESYLRYHWTTTRNKVWHGLIKVWLNLDYLPYWTPDIGDLACHLVSNDRFACAMARIHLLRVHEPIPHTVEGQAAYWKQHYNTPDGAGTIEQYLTKWDFYVEET